MADLETIIREAMLKGSVQSLNVFRNEDGGFQANIGFRDRGASKVVRNVDPAKAVAEAFKAGMKGSKPAPSICDQFEDLLG